MIMAIVVWIICFSTTARHLLEFNRRELGSTCTTGKPYPLFGDGKYNMRATDIAIFMTGDLGIVGQSFGVAKANGEGFIIKISVDGIVLWAKNLAYVKDNGGDSLESVTIFQDYLFAIGYTNELSTNTNKMVLIELDTSGNPVSVMYVGNTSAISQNVKPVSIGATSLAQYLYGFEFSGLYSNGTTRYVSGVGAVISGLFDIPILFETSGSPLLSLQYVSEPVGNYMYGCGTFQKTVVILKLNQLTLLENSKKLY